MKVIIFGATGMIGQGVVRECLADPEVTAMLSVGRSASGAKHEKLEDVIHADLLDYSSIEHRLAGYDACFFCLGVSSAGMSEAAYHRTTFEITMAAASTLVRLAPDMTFIFVSGAGTDSSEAGRTMWARVKGKTENHLLQLPFKAAYMFRPAFVQPLHGIKSRTTAYRILYAILGPLYPLLKRIAPSWVTTTEVVGRAMLRAAREGHPTRVVENEDINRLGS